LKKLLIISPYFPPYHTPDLQRMRMSLPYYAACGWKAEVVTVKAPDHDTPTDPLLSKSIPEDITVHYVNCFSKEKTARFGLGSIALRSYFFYKKKVSELLKAGHYDLIFFSTTQFPLCALGAYWKKKFNVPYVIDMQDPWHSDYYKDKPKAQRPKKYWFSYHLNKYLEPKAMKMVDGLMSVSEKYIIDLQARYPNINHIPTAVITFGYAPIDLQLSKTLSVQYPSSNQLLLAYVGVLGKMMEKSLNLFFDAVNHIADFKEKYHLSFKGTSYASAALAQATALPIALEKGITNIDEDTQRLGIFELLNYLSHADGLLIFGTDEAGYTSSKLYPYLQSGKPILGIFHPQSNAIQILSSLTNAQVVSLDDDEATIQTKILAYLRQIDEQSYTVNQELFEHYSASQMTVRQCELFNRVLANR
jgi:hypothetical protein